MEGLERLIMTMSFQRGLPIKGMADKASIIHTEHIRDVLREVVLDGQISADKYNSGSQHQQAILYCEMKGWITKELSGTSSRKFYAFPTGIHHWYAPRI